MLGSNAGLPAAEGALQKDHCLADLAGTLHTLLFAEVALMLGLRAVDGMLPLHPLLSYLRRLLHALGIKSR